MAAGTGGQYGGAGAGGFGGNNAGGRNGGLGMPGLIIINYDPVVPFTPQYATLTMASA
jgi:hypothetical protein